MKKLIYLIVVIVALGLIVAGCIPVVPPTEQNEPTSLTRGPDVTYYVATTGSDTTGDGSEGKPWLTISHAINQAAPTGDTINVANGLYTITSKILVDKGVTITGNTNNPGNVVVQYASLSTSLIFDMRGSNATIQGIKATKGKSGFWFDQSAVTGCNISNCIVDFVGEYGIYMKNGGSGHTIDSCTISNTGQTNAKAPAILIEDCLGVTFSNNALNSISDKGVYVRVCNATSATNRVEVMGNSILGCAFPCIQVYQSPYTYVYHNAISSTSDKGINIIGPNANSQAERVIVEGNTISGCPWSAILVTHDRYTYIYNNTISSCDDKGISIANGENVGSLAQRIVVEGNTVSGTKWPGIQVYNDIDYTYIHDNVIYNTLREGILAMAKATIEGNEISGGYSGIQIRENATGSIITHNKIVNVDYWGIDIQPDITAAVITNNIIIDSGYCGVIIWNTDDGSGFLVNYNNFEGSGIYGVEAKTTVAPI